MADSRNATATLAEHVTGLRYDGLPEKVVRQAKQVILDSLGCQLACTRLDNGRLLLEFGKGLGGRPEASVIGSDYRAAVMDAALINGSLGHGDEIDESLENAGHTAAVTVPVAMACGEITGASGRDMITGVVAGYDVAGRMADAGIGTGTLPVWKAMASFMGTFWGVGTACSVLKLTPTQARVAFGLAACQAGGYFDVASEARHMAKSLTCGVSARNAVTAALLARSGYDGPQSIFDGPQNVLNTAGKIDYDRLTADLGEKFTIMDTCIKLYAAGHPIHSPVHGLLKIMATESIGPEEIDAMVVRLSDEKRVIDNRDMLEINAQYCLAVTAFDRRLTWDQFAPERRSDPRVLALKDRVTLMQDPVLDERRKITRSHSAEIDVRTGDGRTFTERVDYPPGDPMNPVTWEDIVDKIMYYASKAMARERVQRIVDACARLETIADVNSLGELLRSDGG